MTRLGIFTSAAMLAALPALGAVLVTYENPGLVNTTATFDYVGVETFNARATGSGQSFSTDFGTTGQSTVITGNYSGVDISAANVFGGAGGSNFAVTFRSTGFTILDLTQTTNGMPASGLNYFGYWLSALDAGNKLELIQGGSAFFTFDPAAVIAAVGGCPNGANPYCGNPTTGGPDPGGNAGEPYVFVNFFVTGGQRIEQIRFFEDPEVGGYESDNHTVGFFRTITGTPIPEPASLALLGIGLAGLALSRRRRRA